MDTDRSDLVKNLHETIEEFTGLVIIVDALQRRDANALNDLASMRDSGFPRLARFVNDATRFPIQSREVLLELKRKIQVYIERAQNTTVRDELEIRAAIIKAAQNVGEAFPTLTDVANSVKEEVATYKTRQGGAGIFPMLPFELVKQFLIAAPSADKDGASIDKEEVNDDPDPLTKVFCSGEGDGATCSDSFRSLIKDLPTKNDDTTLSSTLHNNLDISTLTKELKGVAGDDEIRDYKKSLKKSILNILERVKPFYEQVPGGYTAGIEGVIKNLQDIDVDNINVDDLRNEIALALNDNNFKISQMYNRAPQQLQSQPEPQQSEPQKEVRRSSQIEDSAYRPQSQTQTQKQSQTLMWQQQQQPMSIPNVTHQPAAIKLMNHTYNCPPCIKEGASVREMIGQYLEIKFNKKVLEKTLDEIQLFQARLDMIKVNMITEYRNLTEISIRILEGELQDMARKHQKNGDANVEVFNENVERNFKKHYIKALSITRNVIRKYAQLHFDFATKKIGRKLKYIRLWQENPEYRGFIDNDKDILGMMDEVDGRINDIIKSVHDFYEDEFRRTVINQMDRFNLTMVIDTDDKHALIERRQKVLDDMTVMYNKIFYFYNDKVTLMDIILDSQFLLMYLFKIISFFSFVVSLFFAEKFFSEMYMKAVYADSKDPPNIHVFLGILMALHMGFMLFILVVLLLLMFLFKTSTNNFVINTYFIKNFLLDYVMTAIIIVIVGLIVGTIVQKKRYFRYKTEGLRGIRALKELMSLLGIVVFVIPYFYIVQWWI